MPSVTRTAKAGFLAIGKSASVLSAVIVAAALSRLLPKADYGTYQQTILTFQLVAPLLALGLPAAVLYFLPRDQERATSTTIEIVLMLLVMGAVFCGILLLGGAGWVAGQFNNPDLGRSLRWFSTYAFFALPALVVMPTLVARHKSHWVTAFSGIESTLVVLCAVLPVVLFQGNAVSAVQGRVVAAILTLALSFWLLAHTLSRNAVWPKLASIKQICIYSVPLSLATVVATINRSVDKVLVSKFMTPEDAAVFINGAIEVPFIAIVTGSVSSLLAAEFSEKHDRGETDNIMAVWQSAVKKTAAILFPIGALLFAFAEPLMVLLFGQPYLASAVPFQIYLLILPLRVFQGGIFLRMAGKTNQLLAFSVIVTLLNAILTFVMVPLFGMNGAAWATVISVGMIGFPLGIWLTESTTDVRVWTAIPYARLVSVLIISCAVALVAQWIFRESGVPTVVNLVLTTCLMAALSIGFLHREGVEIWSRLAPRT